MKGEDKPSGETSMPGAGLIRTSFGKVSSEMLALKPYWGKPAVRNFREDDGDVGIIRSPVRAIVLPGRPMFFSDENPGSGDPVTNLLRVRVHGRTRGPAKNKRPSTE